MPDTTKHKQTSVPSSPLRRVVTSRAFIIVEIIVLVVLAGAVGKEMIRKQKIETEIKELQARADSLRQTNSELSSLIQYFESDEYTEEQARMQLGLQRPGESVVTVLGAETDDPARIKAGSAAIARTTDQEPDDRSNPQRWWDYYFNSSDNQG